MLIVGAIAGWLAGYIMHRDTSFNLFDLVIGVLGALLGGWLFSVLGLGVGLGILGDIIVATIGAIILVWVLGVIRTR